MGFDLLRAIRRTIGRKRAFQAGPKVNHGRVSDEIPSRVDARPAVHDLADARRSVFALSLHAQVSRHGLQQVEQAETFTARDVDRLAAQRFLARPGKQGGVHGVGDASEIARLRAVAVNHRLIAAHQRFNESRQDRGVWRIRPLTRPEDVEVPQAHA